MAGKGQNLLFYGDNLQVLRQHVKDESVDLVYLDPPFNSNQSYNVLFEEKDGTRSAAQIAAFEDTWCWDRSSAGAYQEVVEGGGSVSRTLQAFHSFLGDSDVMAYLAMMAPRLLELRRVMKSTASLYLHCDPTASHYLKLLLDAVFEPHNFRNEIVWKRSSAHSDGKQGRKQYGRIHDVIFFYTKTSDWKWDQQYTPYSREYIESHYRYVEPGTGRRYRKGDLTASRPGGDTSYEWNGVRPYRGRYWAYSRKKMEEFERQRRLAYTRNGMPEYKRYLDEMPGQSIQDIWDDILPLNSQARERLGYPTQKPQVLLDRIIQTSSHEGDTILDPFCGCGTTIASSQRLKRRWIGIDITHLAVALIKHRLQNAFGKVEYDVVGEPTTVAGARVLAKEDPYQFQWWALGLVGARPTEKKKGADKGIDGRIYFHDEGTGGKTKQVIISVKSGKTSVAHLRDLRGVLDREKSDIGALITMRPPTRAMTREAATGESYSSAWSGRNHPKLQIITIEELLSGKTVDCPPLGQVSVTLKKAASREKESSSEQAEFDLDQVSRKKKFAESVKKSARKRRKKA